MLRSGDTTEQLCRRQSDLDPAGVEGQGQGRRSANKTTTIGTPDRRASPRRALSRSTYIAIMDTSTRSSSC